MGEEGAAEATLPSLDQSSPHQREGMWFHSSTIRGGQSRKLTHTHTHTQ